MTMPPEPRVGWEPSAPAGPQPGRRPNVEQQIERELARLLSDPDKIDSPEGAQQVQDLASALHLLQQTRGLANDKYAVVNVGNGKVALVNPNDPKDIIIKDVTPQQNPIESVPGRGIVEIQRPPAGTAGPTGARPIPNTEPIVQPPGSVQPGQFVADPTAPGGYRKVGEREGPQTVAAGSYVSDGKGGFTYMPDPNARTPAQQQQDAIAQIWARAAAERDAAIDKAKKLVDAGIEMTKSDELKLSNELAIILSKAQSAARVAETEAQHNLDQPNRERELAATESNARTNAEIAENNRRNQERADELARRGQQIDTLKSQGQQGQDLLKMALQAGVSPGPVITKLAINPLREALRLSREAISLGEIPASAMPRVSAPAPAAQRNAPVPRPDLTEQDAMARVNG